MADWTAITGIMVSGIVGPTVGGSLAYAQVRRRRSDEREDDLLRVLDDLVLTFSKARRGLEGMYLCWKDGLPATDPEPAEWWREYEPTIPHRRAVVARVNVRLGMSGPIPDAAKRLNDRTSELEHVVRAYRTGASFTEHSSTEFWKAHKKMSASQSEVTKAIYARVGLSADASR